MNHTLKFLTDNKETITLIVSIVVGIATIITSVVNLYLVKCQVNLTKEQSNIQKSQNQPIFDINIKQQKNGNDGKYDTDILEVRNIGSKVLACKVNTDVFFCLSRHDHNHNDSIYAHVVDYFFVTTNNIVGDGMITQQWCPDNNRIFCDGYFQSLKDSHDGIYYFYEKIVLLKIDYEDIMHENHTLYYKGDLQINKDQYSHYFASAEQVWNVHTFSLSDNIYDEMKRKVDNKNK